jgi:hypothetical protein
MTRRIFCLLLAATHSLAVSQVDPWTLYQQGKQAYDRGECLTAYPALYAFQQSAAPAALSADLAAMLPKAIAYCRNKLDYALQQVPQLQAELNRLRGIGSTTSGLENKPQLPTSLVTPAVQTYSLRCRGGGLAVSIESNTARIRFTTAGAASNSNRLPSGACGWLDRPMGANEPLRICHVVPTRPAVSFSQGTLSASRPWSYFSRLADPGADITFQVKNDGQGCMVTTSEPSVTPPVAVLREDVIRLKELRAK